MAGDPNLRFFFNMSGGTSNVNAALSLGGAVSNFRINSNEPAVTAAAAAGRTRLVLDNVLAAMANSFISIRDGSASEFVSRVIGIQAGAGGYVDFIDPLPAAVAIGDELYDWQALDQSMPWGKDTNGQRSADGFTEYFGGYIVSTGDTHFDFGVHLEEINPGDVVHEICVSRQPTPFLLDVIPNRQTAPDLADMNGAGSRGSFSRPLSFDQRLPGDITLTGFTAIGFWLKRTLPPNAVRQRDQQVSLVCSSSGGVTSRLVLAWNTTGFTPAIEVVRAPTIYVGGGARYRTTVRSVETGLVVPDVPIGMRQTAGPGTFFPPAAPETDERGEVVGHYSAPTDPGDAGQTVTIEAEV